MDAILSVSLTADMRNMQQGFNAAAAVVQQTGATISAVTSNISNNIANVNRLNLNSFNRSLRDGTLSLSNVGHQATRTQADLDRIRAVSSRAGSAMTDFSRIIQDAPFGFIAIQNNLNPMLESFQRLQRESGSTGGALKALAGQLIGAGGLGLAVAVVSSAITAYTLYQQKANKATREAKEANKEYADTLNSIDKGLLKGSQNAENLIVPLRSLYDATQNLTLSEKERVKAVDALQKEYPKYFGNLTNEAILAGKAADKYLQLTNAILAKAQASALEDELKDSAKMLRTLEKRDELNKKALATQKVTDDLRRSINSNDSDAVKFQREKNKEALKGVNILAQQANAEAITVKKGTDGSVESVEIKNTNTLLNESVGILNAKTVELNKQEGIVAAIRAITEKSGVDSIIDEDKTKSSGKKLKTLEEILKELNIALQQNESAVGATFDDKQKGKVDAYQSAVNSLLKNGFQPTSGAVVELQGKLNDLFSSDAKRKADEFFNFTLPTRLAGEAAERIKKQKETAVVALEAAAKELQPLFDTVFAPTAGEKLNKEAFTMNFGKSNIQREVMATKSAIDELEKSFDKGEISFNNFKEKYTEFSNEIVALGLTDQLKQLATSSIADALAGSFNDIGEAIATGGDIIGAAGEGMKKAFANLLSELGKQFITMGVAKIAAGILATPFGGKMVADGAALVALGSGLALGGGILSGGNKKQNVENARKPTAFANGGIVSAPTLGLMGEYSGARNNPEVIAPLNKLKSMLGDTGSNVIIPEVVLQGEQLKLIFDRTNRRLSRI